MKKLYKAMLQVLVVGVMSVAATDYAMAGRHNHGGEETYRDYERDGHRHFNLGVVPPQAKVFGKTYGDWGAEWWKWILKASASENPLFNLNSNYISQNQKGPVWFLAATDTRILPVSEHSVTIPEGKFILLPIIGSAENDYPCPDPSFKPASGQTMADFLTQGTADMMGLWLNPSNYTVTVKIDGVSLTRLSDYRGISQLTKFTADPTEIHWDGCITGTEQVMVTDGFWLIFEPLKPGKHEIESTYTDIKNPEQAHVVYHVTVSKAEESHHHEGKSDR